MGEPLIQYKYSWKWAANVIKRVTHGDVLLLYADFGGYSKVYPHLNKALSRVGIEPTCLFLKESDHLLEYDARRKTGYRPIKGLWKNPGEEEPEVIKPDSSDFKEMIERLIPSPKKYAIGIEKSIWTAESVVGLTFFALEHRDILGFEEYFLLSDFDSQGIAHISRNYGFGDPRKLKKCMRMLGPAKYHELERKLGKGIPQIIHAPLQQLYTLDDLIDTESLFPFQREADIIPSILKGIKIKE